MPELVDKPTELEHISSNSPNDALPVEDRKPSATADQTRGICKSGRPWKPVKERFSSMKKVKPLRTSWKRKMQLKNEKQSLKDFQNQLNEARRQEKLEYRARVEAHRKQKEENSKRSDVVQVITNTAKLKRMKKKQLRKIEKRDTTGVKTKKM